MVQVILLNFLLNLLKSFFAEILSVTFDFTNIASTFTTLHSLGGAILKTSLKFIILTALLVFIRGGIPRYRYDFLTKIG